MKKLINLIMCLFMVVSLSGCNKKETTDENNEESVETSSELTSFYTPGGLNGSDYYQVSEDYETGQQIYNKFALKLLNNIYTKNENDVISPLSLYMALSLLSNGVEGEGLVSLENLLGMTRDDLNNYMKDSIGSVDSYGGYHFANALWFNNSQDAVTLKQSFIDKINEYYGLSVYEDDFQNNKSEVVNKINDWASEQTDGGIKDVISESDVDPSTIFYLLNALAAGDKWQAKFNSDVTLIEEFNNYDGTTEPIEMMNIVVHGYWDGENCEGFVKETETGSIRFVAILPDEGIDIYDFVADLDPETITTLECKSYADLIEDTSGEYTTYLADYYVTNLAFPKFNFSKKYMLTDTLKDLGLEDLFDSSKADFSSMCDGDSGLVAVSDVWQNDTITVNEEKVEASAVTVVEGGLGGGAPDARDVIYNDIKFDRPFVYAIVSGRSTGGKILFAGIYSNSDYQPTEELIPIEIIADGKIKVRSDASTESDPYIMTDWPEEVRMTVNTGDKLFAYEKKEAEGYTWYRLGENAWIADKDGEWIKEL